jgi:hypothetical protein
MDKILGTLGIIKFPAGKPYTADYRIHTVKYQSVCPFVGIASAIPPGGGGQHSYADERIGGHNSDDWTECLALFMLCGILVSCEFSFQNFQ